MYIAGPVINRIVKHKVHEPYHGRVLYFKFTEIHGAFFIPLFDHFDLAVHYHVF